MEKFWCHFFLKAESGFFTKIGGGGKTRKNNAENRKKCVNLIRSMACSISKWPVIPIECELKCILTIVLCLLNRVPNLSPMVLLHLVIPCWHLSNIPYNHGKLHICWVSVVFWYVYLHIIQVALPHVLVTILSFACSNHITISRQVINWYQGCS